MRRFRILPYRPSRIQKRVDPTAEKERERRADAFASVCFGSGPDEDLVVGGCGGARAPRGGAWCRYDVAVVSKFLTQQAFSAQITMTYSS